MKNSLRKRNATSPSGFTLVEMLVVLVIVSTLIGVGASVMKKASSAQGSDTGATMAENLFSEARSLAQSSGAGTRVVIYKAGGKGDEREKHLRYMGIVRQIPTNSSNSGQQSYQWNDQLIARGVSLPQNVFFNARLSGNPPEMSVKIPGFKTPQRCYYFEFNSEGLLVNNSGTTPASFVVQAGVLYPNDDQPREAKKGSRDVSGFAIWKRGNTSLFRNPDQIPTLGDRDPMF
ncbi:prepilin-type N-terminal cleavage/methylation domain-containing protein [Rubritalea marina]|uniref:prepilin-type N-terminal cleavage/methylation domain-containing protein n=1 Tax=Rubritalea marina TaxID=361055 RepID=UPI0009FEB203|nr:prepilin-type N-terminal cleavage/methylation domain-containing protein [Rubritalea marina]